jgi:hypothetical protein
VARSNFGLVSIPPPQLLEPVGVGGGVSDGVLNVPVAEVILNEPHIRTLIGKSEAASVAQRVGMGEQGRLVSLRA